MDRADYEYTPITVVEPKDYGSVGIVGDSIDMSKCHRVCFSISFGAITGNSILSFYTGASAGTKTTQIAFNYRFSGGDYKATSADVFGAEVAVAATGLTLTAATYDHRKILVNIESVDCPDGKNWLTLDIDATATVMLVSVDGLASPLYAGISAPTLI